MATTYKITLSADGYSTIELPVSSFSYRSSNENSTGSCVVEGHAYSAEIADRIGGSLVLAKLVDGVETEILSATIDSLSTMINPDVKSYSIEFTFTAYSQTKYSTALPIDSLITSAANKSSKWSFSIPDIDPQIQHGIYIEYDSIEYYIADVSVSYLAGSFGSMALNEGAEPPQEAGSGVTCTFEILDGVPITAELNNSCAIYMQSVTGGLNYDGYYIVAMWGRSKYYQFELDAEAEVLITVTGSMTDLAWSGVYHSGFECTIATGEFTAFYGMKDYAFSRIYCGGSFTGTLPAGIYTIRLINIVNPASTADSFTLSFEIVV